MPQSSPLPLPCPPPETGRFILEDRIEHRCQLVGIGETGVTLRSAVRVSVGEQVVAYLDRHGRVSGRVSAAAGDLFTMLPAGARPTSPRIGSDDSGASGEGARAERIVPHRLRVLLSVGSGRRYVAQIVDLSRSGVALTCPEPVEAGTTITVGSRGGTIVRRVHRLHGLSFDAPLSEQEFGPDIVL